MKWQENLKTTPPLETPQENQSPNSNANTDAEIEETRRLLTGAMLTQANCTMQFANSLELAVQSNWATPKTVGALSYALWEMVNLTTSMSDQVKALTSILMRLRKTMPSDELILNGLEQTLSVMRSIVEQFDL